MKKKNFLRSILSYVILIAVIIFTIQYMEEATSKEITYTELMGKITAREVKSVEISYEKDYVYVDYSAMNGFGGYNRESEIFYLKKGKLSYY